MRLLRSWGWVLGITLTAFAVAVTTWLVLGSFLKRDVSFWWLLVILVIIVAGTLAQWFQSRDKTKDGVSLQEQLRNPSGLAKIGMAVFYGLGAGLFVQQFVAPTDFDVVKSALDRIEARLAASDTKLDHANEVLSRIDSQTAPRPSRAFDHIAGYWGEERRNCEVVYLFERQHHALTVTLVRKLAVMDDYRMTASIIGDGQGDTLHAVLRTSTESDERGQDPLVFTFHSDGGGYQRLEWLNERRANAGALRLEPCGAPE